MSNDTKLFIGTVTNVYPKRVTTTQRLGNDTELEIVHEAGTIDVLPPVHRIALQGVRVLVPNSGTDSNVNSGFSWLPSVGDTVAVGYLEGYHDFPICFGVLRDPHINYPSEEGQVKDDYIVHHQSDSWIRMRNLEKVNNPSSKIVRSEVKVHHKTGSEIVISEPEENKSEILVQHNTGTSFKIDVEGGITITTEKDISLLGKTVVIGDPNNAQGCHTAETIGFCRYTGEPFNGLPTIKAGT